MHLLVFQKKDLYLVITQKPTFMKSGGFRADFKRPIARNGKPYVSSTQLVGPVLCTGHIIGEIQHQKILLVKQGQALCHCFTIEKWNLKNLMKNKGEKLQTKLEHTCNFKNFFYQSHVFPWQMQCTVTSYSLLFTLTVVIRPINYC